MHLTSSAKLNADGIFGGGKLHVGGAYQGGNDTYRSKSTQIDDGAILSADALSRGDGGEVVVWSDGHTVYSGSISARGGAEGGDGGIVEVSGKQMLDFYGMVDAGASNGKAGSLLLDPYDFTIGMAEASLIDRVLRTGTSTYVSADNDINVNYVIDGRGRYAGGGLTLSAAKDINVNDYIVTDNGAVNLYAGSGTVNLAQGKAVYAGTAPITVRSGSSLTNASYLTGGRLSLISTQGFVNINQGIDSSITPVPGGHVTLAAGNDVNLNKDLVTYDGDVNIAATNGILNIAWDNTNSRTYRIQSGSAPITATTGGNLTTGPAPPTTFAVPDLTGIADQAAYLRAYIVDQLKPYIAFSTTGKLSLISTGGDVTVDAPIPDTTGEIVLTAADKVAVNHKVLSNDQPITITAGAGGIEVNGTDDTYGMGSSYGIGTSPAIDSGSGPLTFRALGDISITTQNGVSTSGKLTIDTRSKILQGAVASYAYSPSEIELIADGGIDSFNAKFSPKISATSSGGAIHLDVLNPGQLIINALSPTAGDVFTGGLIGHIVNIHAGRDINLSNVREGGTLVLNAGRDANLNTFIIDSLDVTAGRNIYFSGSGLASPEPTIWLRGGDLIATSTGGDISFGGPSDYSAVHISDEKNLALDAYGSVTLGLLETLGPVSITARTGDITLRSDIGPAVQFYDPNADTFYASYDQNALSQIYSGADYYPGKPSFDPTGNGPASLFLHAGGNIIMQGAKASGTVTIVAGGTLTPAKGISSGVTNGVNINTGGEALEKLLSGDVVHPGPYNYTGNYFGDIPLATQVQLRAPYDVAPAITPGPRVDPPGLPGALTALPALPPDLVNVSGSGVPGASGANDSLSESEIEAMRAAGNAGLSEIIPDEEENTDEEDNNKNLMEFAGGRGVGQTTDFGIK